MKRKIVSILLAVLALTCTSSCSLTDGVKKLLDKLEGKTDGVALAYHMEVTEMRVVSVPESQIGDATLIDYMDRARLNGGFTYEIKDGMVTSINGKSNTADFSGCWMLYTSDTEFSNTAWGTVEYGEKTLGSAIVGAEELPTKADEIYLWEYCTF